MPTVNEELRDLLIRHFVGVNRWKVGQVRKAISFLNDDVLPDLRDTVESRLTRIRNRGADSGATTTARFKDLVKRVDAILKDGIGELHDRQVIDLQDLAVHEGEFQVAAIRRVSPVALDLEAPSTAVLKQLVTKNPMRGAVMREWYDGLTRTAGQKIRREVSVGLLQGETNESIVRRLVGTRALNYTDGVFEGTRHEAAAIVRTSAIHVSDQARRATYLENADVISGTVWTATLDSRTCPACGALDGQEFPIGDGPSAPLHWNCRCARLPVLKSWRELGIDLKEAPEGTRASMDGQVPESTTYEEWLSGQPASVQDEALGPSRGGLFRSGKLEVGDFADDHGRALSLDQLGKLFDLPEN